MAMPNALQLPSSRGRPLLIGIAGVLVILLSAGAALLPFREGWSGANLVGSLLLAAGILEMATGAIRRESHVLAMTAGAVTMLTGLVFYLDAAAQFVSTIYLIAGWLVLRSVVLFGAGLSSSGTVRGWTLLSAGTDLVLAMILFAGLSATTLSIALFGPSPLMIESFAWVLAISFVVTGGYVLEVAFAERYEEGMPAA